MWFEGCANVSLARPNPLRLVEDAAKIHGGQARVSASPRHESPRREKISDQRHVGLPIRRRQASSVTALLPPKTRVAPPGHYLVFLLRNGVPSTGRFVRVDPKSPAS